MPTVTRAQLEAMPGFSAEFHLGEKAEPVAPAPATAADEKHFMADVIREAKRCGWLVYHTHNSRRSQAGFPDLVMIRGCRMIVAELKTETGKTSPQQDDWLLAFNSVAYTSDNLEVHVWTPSMWPEIERTLA